MCHRIEKPTMIYNEDKVIVMRTAIKYLQFVYLFPKNGNSYNLKLYVKFYIVFALPTIPILVGLIGHFYQSYLEKNVGNMVYDFYFVNYVLMFTFVTFLVLCKGSEIIHLLHRMSKIDDGYRKEYRQKIKFIDDFTRFILNSSILVIFIVGIDGYTRDIFCKNEEISNDPHYICHMKLPLWFPFKINKNLRLLFAFYEGAVMCLFMSPPLAAIISTYFLSELITVRIRYVRKLLRRLKFDDENLASTRSKIYNCVDMYIELCCLVRELNDTVGFIMAPSHNANNTAMIAACGYLIIKTHNYSYVFEVSVWLFVQWLACYCGQIIEDEHEFLRVELYNTKWYDMNPCLRRTLINFQSQVDMPLHLKITPLHVLNMDHLAEVIKGTYSILMFLLNM